MKRWKTLFTGMIFCLLLLTGCGKSYETDTSTVFVEKSGEIVSVDVETFDEATYDKADLESYVKEVVENYTTANGKGTVELKELKVEDGTAKLMMQYTSADDYAKFTGIELFSGSIIEALSKGYSFDMDFAAIDGENVKACEVNDFLGNSDYKVVIIKGNVNVKVPGTILYASVKNATIVDKSTIAIAEKTSLLQQDVEDTENTEVVDNTEVASTEIETEELSEDEFVNEDDLLGTDEEVTGPVFEFDDDKYQPTEVKNEFSEIYNYIIYK